MKRPQTTVVSIEPFLTQCLGSLARILVSAGHTPDELLREFTKVCSTLQPGQQAWDEGNTTFMADLGHVLTYWHSDPDYMDSKGKPLKLPLDGAEKSLSALVRRALPQRDVHAVIGALTALGGISSKGTRFVPTAPYLTLQQEPDSGLHGLMALLGMLQTVERNSSERGWASRLIERTAVNPRLPVAALPAFYRQLERLTTRFLTAVDRDMQRREGASKAQRRVGVGVFAFEQPAASKVPQPIAAKLPEESTRCRAEHRRPAGRPRQR